MSEMSAVTVPLRELQWAVRAVQPHVCDDDSLPMIASVLFEAVDGYLHVVATDRFTLAVARIVPVDAAVPELEPEPLLVARKDLRSALTAVGSRRKCDADRPVRLAVSHGANAVTFERDDQRVTVPTGNATTFPNWRGLLESWKPAEHNAVTGLDAWNLTRWERARRGGVGDPGKFRLFSNDPMRVQAGAIGELHGRPLSALAVSIGDDFVGLQMGMRDADTPPLTGWVSARPAGEVAA